MGTSRIKIIDLSAGDEQIKTSRKRAEHGLSPEEIAKLSKKTSQEKQTQESAPPISSQSPTQPSPLQPEEEKGRTPKALKTSKSKAKKRSKRYLKLANLVNRNQNYSLTEAINLVKKTSQTKFDSTVEAHFILNNPVQGNITLPHPFGHQKRVLAFANNFPASESIIVGSEKTIEEIRNGKLVPGRDFQAVYATPEFMPKLATIAKTLGPKGLMPNPKTGTIITDVNKALKTIAAGQITYKTENKAPVLHLAVGKVSQNNKDLEENLKTIIGTIGPQRINKAYLTSTMGPSIRITLN